MSRSRWWAGVALGVALLITAAEVRSNGTCNYTLTGGSVTFSAPAANTCYTLGGTESATASFNINWRVDSISPGTETYCDASVGWTQNASSDEPASGWSSSWSVSDSISNANVGATGSFSRSRTWTGTATTAGNWNVTGKAMQGTSVIASASRAYSVGLTCP